MPKPTYESWMMDFRLEPNVHYVEVDSPADVPVKLAWLRSHQDEAQRIAKAGQLYMSQFADRARELEVVRRLLLRAAALYVE